MNIKPKGYISITELVIALNTSKSTIDKMITKKIITKRIRFGQGYYYKISEVTKEIQSKLGVKL